MITLREFATFSYRTYSMYIMPMVPQRRWTYQSYLRHSWIRRFDRNVVPGQLFHREE